MAEIITIWGSQDTGKTVFSTKLAQELGKENSVMLVYSDTLAPPMASLLVDINEKGKSLGRLLASQIITQEEILKHCVTLKTNKNICYIGYNQGEHFKSNAEYDEVRGEEVLINMAHLVDYLIIDVTCAFMYNVFSQTAMRLSDHKIRFYGPTLKDVSYFKSNLSLLANHYKLENDICVLSKITDDVDQNILKTYFSDIKYMMPYTSELKTQVAEGEILKELKSKDGKTYNNIVGKIAKKIKKDICDENLESESIKKNFGFKIKLGKRR